MRCLCAYLRTKLSDWSVRYDDDSKWPRRSRPAYLNSSEGNSVTPDKIKSKTNGSRDLTRVTSALGKRSRWIFGSPGVFLVWVVGGGGWVVSKRAVFRFTSIGSVRTWEVESCLATTSQDIWSSSLAASNCYESGGSRGSDARRRLAAAALRGLCAVRVQLFVQTCRADRREYDVASQMRVSQTI